MSESKNLYIRTVSLGNRKSCPECKIKLNGNPIYSSGEYLNGKWNTTNHFCRNCFPQFQEKINLFQEQTKRFVVFKGYQGFHIPDWFTPEMKI